MDKYLVGGAVRDELMGKTPKDFDYSVVANSFEEMRDELLADGYKIFVEKPEFFTIRARKDGQVADFVWAREEGPYSDGRHPDWVKPGTLEQDLARRDFTINAMAKDKNGKLIDPFDGRTDLMLKVLRAVGDPEERIREDPLRVLRAIRFSITLKMDIDDSLSRVMNENWIEEALRTTVSQERIREELIKCFAKDTIATMVELVLRYPNMMHGSFNDKVWLKPTMEER